MLKLVLPVVLGWRYWSDVPRNMTIHCGPSTTLNRADWPYVISDDFYKLYRSYGVFDDPVWPVVVGDTIEVARVMDPHFVAPKASWMGGNSSGFETSVVWFFHAPGSGLFLNVSGRPITHEIYHNEDYAAVKRTVADGTVMVRYAAWYGATEVIVRTDDAVAPTHGVACPNVPFTCKCAAPHNFAMCENASHQPANRVDACYEKKPFNKCIIIAAVTALAAVITTACAIRVWLCWRDRVPRHYALVAPHLDEENARW
jgi:hypothetical protein